jgi:hypothetical protein
MQVFAQIDRVGLSAAANKLFVQAQADSEIFRHHLGTKLLAA